MHVGAQVIPVVRSRWIDPHGQTVTEQGGLTGGRLRSGRQGRLVRRARPGPRSVGRDRATPMTDGGNPYQQLLDDPERIDINDGGCGHGDVDDHSNWPLVADTPHPAGRPPRERRHH